MQPWTYTVPITHQSTSPGTSLVELTQESGEMTEPGLAPHDQCAPTSHLVRPELTPRPTDKDPTQKAALPQLKASHARDWSRILSINCSSRPWGQNSQQCSGSLTPVVPFPPTLLAILFYLVVLASLGQTLPSVSEGW